MNKTEFETALDVLCLYAQQQDNLANNDAMQEFLKEQLEETRTELVSKFMSYQSTSERLDDLLEEACVWMTREDSTGMPAAVRKWWQKRQIAKLWVRHAVGQISAQLAADGETVNTDRVETTSEPAEIANDQS